MNKAGSAAKVKLNSFDDLFGNQDIKLNADVKEIALSELFEFANHPFKVLDDEKMHEMVQSIKEYGVIVPGIVRRRKEGGYEMIAGHRRKRASELAGLKTMPVRVMELSDDEAVAYMVDSNIQRETILPSEKAKAYKMRYETTKHQGKSGSDGRHYSLEQLSSETGEGAKTIQRYIWLGRLIEPLLNLVDDKRLGFVQGVDISFLDDRQQRLVYENIHKNHRNVSKSQAGKLKQYGKNGELTAAMVDLILSEEKEKGKSIVFRETTLKKYFPADYSKSEMEQVVIQLLEDWKGHQDRADPGNGRN